MKTLTPIRCLFFLVLVSSPLRADIFFTNFGTLGSNTEATGVWRNSTSGTDLAFPVSLNQSNGVILLESDDDPSETANGFPWADDPIIGTDLFNPNFSGDYINIEVSGGATVSVVIDFGAQVTDPTLLFTDVDTQTTLTFLTANPVKTGGLANMLVSGNTAKTSGVVVPLLFGSTEETLGSLKFTGTFTKLEFTISNDGSDPINDEDRTGFCVATEFPPVALPAGSSPTVDIDVDDDVVTFDWGAIGAINALLMLNDSNVWVTVPGSNPAGSSTYVGSKMVLGPTRLFRADYTP